MNTLLTLYPFWTYLIIIIYIIHYEYILNYDFLTNNIYQIIWYVYIKEPLKNIVYFNFDYIKHL